MKKTVLTVLAVIALTLGIQAQQTRTIDSGVYTAPKTGHQTKTNDCHDATCVYLSASIPLGSQIVAMHCYANIALPRSNGDDLPHYQFNEVECGVDSWWSIFDYPVVESSPQAITVRTTYHNRSDNRDRDAKLVVEYIPPAGR